MIYLKIHKHTRVWRSSLLVQGRLEDSVIIREEVQERKEERVWIILPKEDCWPRTSLEGESLYVHYDLWNSRERELTAVMRHF